MRSENWARTSINGLIHLGRPRILVAALLGALAIAYAPVARAGGVVSSCDEASLLTAVTGGGMVTFTCSGTITLTATITILADTTIDGAGQNVTISGGNAVRVFFVPSGVQLNLNKITIANGNANSSTYAQGGGIASYGTLTVTNSTFSGNSAQFVGGGIFSFGTLTVTNSTFAGNSAQLVGGGIFSYGTLTVTNSTFTGNSAPVGFGGGIYHVAGGTVTLRNTIVANSPSGGNCAFGSPIDGSGNLDTDGTCGGTMSPDPLLGPLQNNGGPTQTLAISMASPAFGGANPANCPATDQRGVLRPQFLSCDIGAFEFDTANSLLAAVRNEISALIPTGNQLDQRILSAAASELSAALNSHNWQGTDGNHLNSSKAAVVFLGTDLAAAGLTRLLNASSPSAIPAQTLQTLLNNLTLAGRTLAAVAISDAAGGNATKLAQANALLAKGDTNAGAGKNVAALLYYEFAWGLVQ